MLSGPTYLSLVRHFWVRAQLYDQKAAQLELEEKVLIDPSLKGKTREEMGLEPFRGEEIRSSVLGIPVAISVDTIAGVIRRASGGKPGACVTTLIFILSNFLESASTLVAR